MEQPNRNYTDGTYRYGFQGQEKDDELKGKGNSVNYKYRMHDPRVGRFFAVDPLAPEYPWNSTYAFSENRVIDAYELEGLEAKLYTSKEENEKGIYSYDKGQVLEDATTVGKSWDRKGFRIQLHEKNGVHFYVLSRIDKKNTTYLSDIYGKMLQGAYVVTSKEGFAHIMQNSEKFYNRSIQQFHDNTINTPIENPVVRFIANGGLGLFSGGSIRSGKELSFFLIRNSKKLRILQSQFEDLADLHLLQKYRKLDPDLNYGYTGSFRTGFVGNSTKPRFGKEIDLDNYDIDFWIESNILHKTLGASNKPKADVEFRKILNETPGFEGLKPNKKGFSILFKPSVKK